MADEIKRQESGFFKRAPGTGENNELPLVKQYKTDPAAFSRSIKRLTEGSPQHAELLTVLAKNGIDTIGGGTGILRAKHKPAYLLAHITPETQEDLAKWVEQLKAEDYDRILPSIGFERRINPKTGIMEPYYDIGFYETTPVEQINQMARSDFERKSKAFSSRLSETFKQSKKLFKLGKQRCVESEIFADYIRKLNLKSELGQSFGKPIQRASLYYGGKGEEREKRSRMEIVHVGMDTYSFSHAYFAKKNSFADMVNDISNLQIEHAAFQRDKIETLGEQLYDEPGKDKAPVHEKSSAIEMEVKRLRNKWAATRQTDKQKDDGGETK